MYLENLKIDYGNLQENIKKLEEDYKEHADDSLLVEIVHLKENLIKLGYKIKRENLFNDYRNKKPISYHFIDSDGSEIDVMLDYGDVNYESAYKQNRNNLFADEAWDVMNFERENNKFFKPSLTVSNDTQKLDEGVINNQSFSNNIFVNAKFLIFKKSNNIHIVSDVSVNYLKNNSNLIKKFLNDKSIRFIIHNVKSDEMLIDDIVVKIDSDGFVLKGNVDEYESSEKVSVLSENVKQKYTNISNNVNKKSSDKTNSNKKEIDILELIGLMEKNDLSSVIKLIRSYGSSFLWKSLDEGLEKGLISIHKFNFVIDYLKKYIRPDNPLYTEYFNKDFDNLIKKHSESKKVDSKDSVAHIIPTKPVKRKKAKNSLIEKYKELSRGKKIAVVAAVVIAAVGIGLFATHMIPMIMDKINSGDTLNSVSSENVKMVTQASKGILNNVVDKAQDSFQLVKDSIPHFNSVNAGDTVFRSASDSISGINGVSASGDFRDTVVAVFDSSAQKVIKLTPDNIDSVRNLLDDPNVPKAFGDSFTPGNVSGWKTGSGYKTIFDVVKSVGGKSL